MYIFPKNHEGLKITSRLYGFAMTVLGYRRLLHFKPVTTSLCDVNTHINISLRGIGPGKHSGRKLKCCNYQNCFGAVPFMYRIQNCLLLVGVRRWPPCEKRPEEKHDGGEDFWIAETNVTAQEIGTCNTDGKPGSKETNPSSLIRRQPHEVGSQLKHTRQCYWLIGDLPYPGVEVLKFPTNRRCTLWSKDSHQGVLPLLRIEVKVAVAIYRTSLRDLCFGGVQQRGNRGLESFLGEGEFTTESPASSGAVPTSPPSFRVRQCLDYLTLPP
ncbi:uncharacterized protein BDR25DRAFT_361660 [Lindgomyces ingoldianus]|uniref:Uncharacterized protein n=1 Tax=Lindgomyces ingoldianus TaxID=673940 RepID=A0ACB6QE16_9PLEO|nr:uncharacterized protein BDR25DRAFT_361660 [Lindgomyces ingoldianus]KAF2464390.1 hypothetical protein BDR25DRAFT_361660 [Lindgomyces ingoldianus]